jgi:hypothetical protein
MPSNDTAIVLFAYKRPVHVEKVLESLITIHEIKQYHLIIFQDGPKNSSEEHEVNKTTEVIKRYLSKFASTEISIADSNQGLARSVVSGLNYAFKNYNKCIILEDDIVVGPRFISYMQRLLDENENNLNIGSVTGFQFVSRFWRRKTNLYLSPRHSSWGWGTWRRTWEKVDWEIVKNNYLQETKYKKRISEAGDDLLGMIDLVKKNQIDSWSVIFDLNMIVQGLLCIHPIKQYCRNIGMDGTGTHYSDSAYENPYEELTTHLSTENDVSQAKQSSFYDSQLRWKYSRRNINYISIMKSILRRIKRR